jgi:ferredoxin
VVSGQVKLYADREVCIGAGLCVLADDKVFDQDDEGIVVLVDDRPIDGEGVQNAVRNCPSGALRISAGSSRGC